MHETQEGILRLDFKIAKTLFLFDIHPTLRLKMVYFCVIKCITDKLVFGGGGLGRKLGCQLWGGSFPPASPDR